MKVSQNQQILILFIIYKISYLSVGFRLCQSPNNSVECEEFFPVDNLLIPYAQGNVGVINDPNVPLQILPATVVLDEPIIWPGATQHQTCPGMVGPVGKDTFYCTGKEYGQCDRATGVCYCNPGYQGLDCTQCSSTHYPLGLKCYPKQLCPNSCSDVGKCNVMNGLCECPKFRTGNDCSIQRCSSYDSKCISCNSAICISCIQGYFMNSTSSKCESCSIFDPRCYTCSETGCLKCSDLLLSSIRRSGARDADPALPQDELQRNISISLPFGTQDPRYFDEAEAFDVIEHTPMNGHSLRCEQGRNFNKSWTCTDVNDSYIVCGNIGTIKFSSPVYTVNENASTLRIDIQRSGGGVGEVSLSYQIRHITTDDSDVTETANYTSSTFLTFLNGVTELSILLTIHEDKKFETNEKFQILLYNVSKYGVLGPQKMTMVTIVDNESKINDTNGLIIITNSNELLSPKRTSDMNSFLVQAVTSSSMIKTSGGDIIRIQVKQIIDADKYNSYHEFFATDNGNGSYNVSWRVDIPGKYKFDFSILSSGGLQAHYYNNLMLQDKAAVSRIDSWINFAWEFGAPSVNISKYFSSSWDGYLMSDFTGPINISIEARGNVRLWINDVIIINKWDRLFDNASAILNAKEGMLYKFLLEYRRIDNEGLIQVYWSYGYAQRSIIPLGNFYYANKLETIPVVQIVKDDDSERYTKYPSETLEALFAMYDGWLY